MVGLSFKPVRSLQQEAPKINRQEQRTGHASTPSPLPVWQLSYQLTLIYRAISLCCAVLDARFRFPRIPWLPADAGKNLLCVKMCWLHSKVLCAGCQVGFISVFRSLCVWSSYHAWRALCSLVSLSLSLDPPWLNIAKWFSHSRRIAAALLESIRPADLWPSLMYVYPFLLTLHCAKTPTRSSYPGKCSNLLPTPPFPSLATLFCQLLARL